MFEDQGFEWQTIRGQLGNQVQHKEDYSRRVCGVINAWIERERAEEFNQKDYRIKMWTIRKRWMKGRDRTLKDTNALFA